MWSYIKELFSCYKWYEKLVFAVFVIAFIVSLFWYRFVLDDFDRMIFRAINSPHVINWLLWYMIAILIWIICRIFIHYKEWFLADKVEAKRAAAAGAGAGASYSDVAKFAMAFSRNPHAFEKYKDNDKLKMVESLELGELLGKSGISTDVQGGGGGVPSAEDDDYSGASADASSATKPKKDSDKDKQEKHLKLKIKVNFGFALFAVFFLITICSYAFVKYNNYKKTDIVITYKLEKGKVVPKDSVVKRKLSYRYKFLIDDILDKKMEKYDDNRKANIGIIKDLISIYEKDTSKKDIKYQLKQLPLRWKTKDSLKSIENIGNIEKDINGLK